MIWIRADANSDIGTGHVMRCISIAQELQKSGQEVWFVCADETSAKLLEAKGQRYYILNTDYRDMENELDNFLFMLCEQSPDALLIDSYYVTAEYLKKLGECVKTVFIDDMAFFPYPVDVLINYNIFAGPDLYKDYLEEKPYFLLGMDYAPLRSEFRDVSYDVQASVKDVLITTGGSDKYNLAGQILKKLLSDNETKELNFHVVSGVFNQHLSILEELKRTFQNVHVYTNLADMSKLMQKCDLAVSAAGSTVYELLAIGVPVVTFSFVDNQVKSAEAFGEKKVAVMQGHYEPFSAEEFVSGLTEGIKQLMGNCQMREELMKKGRQLVDGNGARRIAEAIIRHIK